MLESFPIALVFNETAQVPIALHNFHAINGKARP